MSRKAKKTVRKKRPNARPAPRPRRALLWRIGLFSAGLAIGLMLPWLLWLNHVVTSEFDGRKWDLPSRVFARPLTLYEGLPLSAAALETELSAAGYEARDSSTRAGSYSRRGNEYEVHRRAFEFDDGRQAPARFSLRLNAGEVQALKAEGTAVGLVRLDPAQIASIYPLHDEDRTLVALDEVPELLVTGLQAVEDRNFKNHHGVHLRGIARALVANIKAGQAVQGGSTLTQQLVKNYYLSSERTLARKVNEALMALLLELHYSKTEIIEAYLNEIFLGQQGRHGIHGFARASEFYFGRPLAQLDTEHLALMVGMVRGASLYNPRRNPQRALERRNRVLDIFAETGLITATEAQAAAARPLGVTLSANSAANRYPAFIELVRRQLKRDYREQDLRSAGLRIFTTLAPMEQEAAHRAMRTQMDAMAQRGLPDDLQGALVLADAASGEIRALVGDRNPQASGFNRALDARRQIGSVIKPLVYLLALEHPQEYTLLTRIADQPISLRQPDGSNWSPENFDHVSHGEVHLLEALTKSYNQATVQLGLKLGVHHLVSKLKELGIEAPIEALPSTLLGAVELTPLEVTQIYQAFAAGGFAVPLRAVTAVQTPGGAALKRYPLRLMPLPNREAVAVLNFAMTQVVETGTARALPGLLGQSVVMAGKTGTTNEQRDSWFVGYTRDRVATVWVGRDDNRPAGVTGSNAALHVWAGLFRQLPLKAVDLDMPEGAYWTWVDLDADARTDATCAGAVQLPFIEGSEPGLETACLARIGRKQGGSFWRKWFERD